MKIKSTFFMLLMLIILSISLFIPSLLYFKIFLLCLFRVLNHLSFWGSLWDVPWTWRFFVKAFLTDLFFGSFFFEIGYATSEMGFGGGVEGRSDIVTMDANPQQEQGGPSTSTPHTDGGNQAPSEQRRLPTEAELDILKGNFDKENQLADLILKIRKEDRMRSPAPERLHRVVEMLEEAYGEGSLDLIIRDIQTHGKQSQYYKDCLTCFNILKGLSSKELRDYANRIVE